MDFNKPKKKKALFVVHDTGIYGASRSLQTFLKEYEGAEVHFVVKKKLFKTNDSQAINNFFHNKVKSIREFYLPLDLCFKGKGKYTLRSFVYDFLFWINKFRLYAYMKSQNFDFIHLNSLVLHPLIVSDLPFIIHVREIYDGSNEKVKRSLLKAKGVIFIDESTKEPFRKIGLNASLVLNNPIDMAEVCTRTQDDQRLKALTAGRTVFSLIGGIDDNKGVDFIIEAFSRLSSPKALLLIVGNGQESFIKRCKEIAGSDKRIVFFGEEPDIKKIYQVSDYILRGEAYFCIGRTIFEGLYAGCNVIIPGQAHDGAKFFEFRKFEDNIFFYQPRSAVSLLEVLEKQAGEKIARRSCGSNLPYHLANFSSFVQKIGL